MPRSERIMVYPDPAALEYLNATTPGKMGGTLNLAIEVFADLIARTTAKNADTFSRREWSQIAVACGHERFEVSSTPLSVRLANCTQRPGVTRAIVPATLTKKLALLPELQAWAIVWSLRTLDVREADFAKDEWWTLKFRTAKEGKG